MPSACCVLHRRRKTFFGRCALLCLLLAACFPKKKTLFEKNFLDLSVEGCALGRLRCLLRAACFNGMNFLGLSVDGRHTGVALLCLLLAACFLKKKNFLREELSRPFCGGTRIGTPTMPTACCLFPEEEKLSSRRTF